MVFQCCVCKKTNKEVILHRFPYKDEEIYSRWLNLIGRANLKSLDTKIVHKNYGLCDEHFPHEVKIDEKLYASKSGFIYGACPTLLEHSESKRLIVSPEAGCSRDNTEEELLRMRTPTPSYTTTTQETPRIIRKGGLKYAKIITCRKDLKKRMHLLKTLNSSRVEQLTPKARRLYSVATNLKRIASSLQEENASMKTRSKAAMDFSQTEEFIHSNVNETTPKFLLSQLKQQPKKIKGRRYSLDDKFFALAIMKQSPRGYRLLQKTFALPSRKTLNKLLRQIPFRCGINKPIFECLASATKNLAEPDQYAILMWDEISLESGLMYNENEDTIIGFEDCGSGINERPKKIADHAMVFMLRGIRRKWKQPVAYFFSDSGMSTADLQRNIKNIVREARSAGIKVVASVSDQFSVNSAADNGLLKETDRWCSQNDIENRFLGYLIDGEEVVHLFDAPHLLKCIRNALLEHDIKFKWKHDHVQVASWRDIVKLYENDSRLDDDYKLCHRLTDEHIYKNKMKKMKVKLAAQVFSQRVASIMRAFSNEDGQSTTNDTSDFIFFMDKLFDSVNGSTIRPVDGKTLRVAVSDNSPHHNFWNEALKVLESIRMISEKKGDFVTPSVTNFIKTIKGIRYLFEKLKKKGFRFLCPRNLNQDPLENFFGSIRFHGVRNVNPDPNSFHRSFKTLIINSFSSAHFVGSNCELDDGVGALTNLKELFSINVTEQPPILRDVTDTSFTFDTVINPKKIQTHSYLAGYVCRKLFKKKKITALCVAQILSPMNLKEKSSF